MTDTEPSQPPMPLSIIRAWCFRSALMAFGFTDDEISVSAMPTLAREPKDGKVLGIDPNDPDIAVCVTVRRAGKSWSAPMALWPLEAHEVVLAWANFCSMVQSGKITASMLEEASKTHVFEKDWMRRELELHGLMPENIP